MSRIGSDLEAIFAEALARPEGSGRDRYLDDACHGDDALRSRVEALLRAHRRAGGFLEIPARWPGLEPIDTGAGRKSPASNEGMDVETTAAYDPVIANPATPSSGAGSLPRGTSVRYFGDYEIREVLGRGGMGIVYSARQVSLDRPVALKMIRVGTLADEAELRRFQNEAESIARFDHSGIVPIYEVGEHDGQRYFSMKLIAGGSLADRLAAYKDDPRAAAVLLADVAEAVHHAHMRGILHRDLKPANILVNAEGQPHVTDFGLARRVEAGSDITLSGAILGTPSYMAPEQASGRRGLITTATDVYGLGAILYALLTGQAPFVGDSVADTLEMVREQPPQRPRKLNTKAPRDLEVICLKCLEKDPTRRYTSAQAVADDLRSWLESRPIVARPVGVVTRTWLWCRRKPAVAALTAAVAAAVVGGTAAVIVVQTLANRDLTVALKRGNAARDDASNQATLAQEAIQSFYTGISEDVILRRPELEGLRKRLLGTALSFYQKLGDSLESPHWLGKDAGRMRSLAWSLDHVALLQALLGNRDEAIRTRRKAVEVFDALPGRLGALAAAEARLVLGNLQRQAGHPDDALLSLREALARFERLNTEGTYEAKVALALADLGRLLGDTGHVDEARQALERARAIQEELVRMAPKVKAFRNDLAATYTTLGNQLESEKQRDEALHAYEMASRIYEDLVARNPKAPYTQAELARALNNLGLALARSGRTGEGHRTVERGLKIRAELLADWPLNIEFRSDLARSHFHLAMVQVLAGAPAGALQSIVKAEELYAGVPPKSPEDIYFQACLKAMRSGLLGAGKAEADLTPAERAEQRRTADEAMSLLEKGGAAGYRSVPLLKNDPPLEPLRSRPDFQKLLRPPDGPSR
jgi:tetratricopeptide (TPR) repeat protein